MTRKIVMLIVSCLMVLSLVIASCGKADTEVVGASSEKPEYGGTLTLALGNDPTWNLFGFGAAWPQMQAHQRLWDGNWAKGLAGGYGEKETDWGSSTNIPSLDTGYLAMDKSWKISDNGSEITTTYTIRQGVHFASVDSEAGRLVGGREVTIDDIIWNWNQRIHNEEAQNYQLYPFHRYPEAVKTGPYQFSITHKFEDHLGAIMRENVSTTVFPPELWDAYGYESCTDWQYSVGTGPFMITDYVAGNTVQLERNPNYWMTNPIGPGKGDKLPYLDSMKYIIMTDESTRHAALRTGQLDQMGALFPEDKDLMLQTAPDMLSALRGSWSETPLFMNTSVAPFNDINVRKALMMATNFDEINQGLYKGMADIISWPYFKVGGYEPLFVSPDDEDLPAAVKELYTYDLEKAKKLMTDAGYPDGFKTTLAMGQNDVDYYSIIADQWSKINIEIEMQPLDFGALISTAATVGYTGLIAIFTSPNSSYPEQSHFAARNWVNASLINEPYVDKKAEEIRALAIDDFYASMELSRPLIMYLLEKAYMIPTPRIATNSMWWPWLKNYTGETSVGYFPGDSWTQWIWIDQELKTSMGY